LRASKSRRLAFAIKKTIPRHRQTPAESADDLNASSSGQSMNEHQQSDSSLLDLLRELPGTRGIEFEPPPVQIQLRPFDLD